MTVGEQGRRDEVIAQFDEAVNMTPTELERWLGTEDSRQVGQKASRGGESVGHASGRRIAELRQKKKGDLTEDDLAHMRKVVGYVRRHLAQQPSGRVQDAPWRYSLMNWGHDPLKDDGNGSRR
ncbi:DNA-binding protein [Streptomyces sulfonofaciens]|uniref:DNA-binding protein n=1 Tax=Streptomyces sulfonofaciens TaxID=68272 RepID=A0A919FSU1_9ACTN|nr:DUF3140 domain-containing protein [Streptomyces sulfonofaciens]GHH71766.1 DNA-binding protein [Streptomyces sulfonofaciens]